MRRVSAIIVTNSFTDRISASIQWSYATAHREMTRTSLTAWLKNVPNTVCTAFIRATTISVPVRATYCRLWMERCSITLANAAWRTSWPMRRSRKCKISLLSGIGTRVPFLDSHQEYLHPALPSNGSLPMVMSWPPDDMSKIILIPVHEHLGTSLAGALDRGVVLRTPVNNFE